MNGSLKVVQAIVLLSFAGLFFTSCGGNQSTLASTTTSGTTTTNPTPAASEPTTEEEEKNATIPSGYDAGNLFVTVPDTIDYLNFSSTAGSHSQRCSFTSSSIVNDLTCVVEAGELALYFDGIKFQYNVPANQCKYIGTYPYWYYNSEIGTGPTVVSATVVKNASGTITSSSCTVDGVGPFACDTLTPPTAWNDVYFDTSGDGIEVRCRYDTTDQDGGVNCCLGKYNLTTTMITPDGTTSNPTEYGKAWGGSVEACIGGAGKTDWEHKTSSGYPAYLIEKMTSDVARTKIYKVSPPIQKVSARSNVPIANYFTSGIHTHSGFGTASGVVSAATPYVPVRPSPYPYYVDPISDRSGSFVVPGNPHYIFDCLDEAFETNYRIRMMVQEWDTVAALTSYISTGVSSPVGADEPGTAPTDCPGLSGDDCNQAQDNDNFVLEDVAAGSYINSFPASRTLYFPKHSYE